MKLDDISFDTSSSETLTIKHPSIDGVVLNLKLRNPLSFDYKKQIGKAYGPVYAAFEDKSEANIILEAVAAVEGWDIDDKDCTLEAMIELFSDSNYEWIAISAYDHIIGKKLLGMKV